MERIVLMTQDKERFLFENFDVLRNFGQISSIPNYIEEGLASHIELREYQKEALENFITYMETPKFSKNKLIHLLFHMATGSGKTVLMAALILYLYTKGYKRVLFFVDQTNILEKTKDNFLNPSSSKYLFKESLNLLGNNVEIKEVSNFSSIDENAINICFSTTQGLHSHIRVPEENQLSITDFEDNKVLLIADEAHHVNTWTKNPNKDEKLTERSWEETVMKIHKSNTDNILLDFTATANLKDDNVREKYQDKIIYDYPLRKFRDSGYTKEFDNFQTDYDVWNRTLIALIISEYRRYMFADNQMNVKPVVLFKSKNISESKEFFEEFFPKLRTLTSENIIALGEIENSLFQNSLSYFKEKDETYQFLVETLKVSFQKENSIIMNSKSTDNAKEKQLAVNSLEDKDNPYRIIFTVDMLSEGWDVLNLYDIVRLYETRQGNTATTREAQLIGRGARYYPFKIEEYQEEFKRKYDSDLENKYRILETLLYHSKQDSKYISELREALKETGLIPDEAIEKEYQLKDTFKQSSLFKEGKVFTNKRVQKDRTNITKIDGKIRNKRVRIQSVTGKSSLQNLFDETMSVSTQPSKKAKPQSYKFKDIPLSILYAGVESYDLLTFNQLKDRFPNLSSVKEFVISDNYLGNMTLIIDGLDREPTSLELFEAVKQSLLEVTSYISGIKGEFEGTKEFYEKPLREVIRNKKIKITNPNENGVGISQREVSDTSLQLNLENEDWYVYNDNYGTSEEKALVKYIHDIFDDLQQKYSNVYLVRNERIDELAIYTFDTGERFEPDFLLFLQENKSEGYIQQQIYIEPKGSHLLETDKWKEEFLKEINDEAIPTVTYVDNNDYRIFGLPFYNTEYKIEEFTESMDNFLK